VSPKDISSICSSCGKAGKKQNEFFICGSCGAKTDKYINAALNIKNKYLSKGNI
ncbi:MAG: transposase, partial [Firmicutes bacterium]|nr:transposase [Bacillota bacterium]